MKQNMSYITSPSRVTGSSWYISYILYLNQNYIDKKFIKVYSPVDHLMICKEKN